MDGNGNAAYYVGNEIGDDGLAHLNELSCEMMWTIAGDGHAACLSTSFGPSQRKTLAITRSERLTWTKLLVKRGSLGPGVTYPSTSVVTITATTLKQTTAATAATVMDQATRRARLS